MGTMDTKYCWHCGHQTENGRCVNDECRVMALDAELSRLRAEPAQPARFELTNGELTALEEPWHPDHTVTVLQHALRRCMAQQAQPEPQNCSAALSSVINERGRQDAKWGEQNHDPFTYLTILTEEVGELAQASLQTRFGGNKGGLDRMREEAVQTAAVALAIVECLDRGKWEWAQQAQPCPECAALTKREGDAE